MPVAALAAQSIIPTTIQNRRQSGAPMSDHLLSGKEKSGTQGSKLGRDIIHACLLMNRQGLAYLLCRR